MSDREHLRPGDVLTIAQALKILPIPKSTIHDMIEARDFPAFPVRQTSSGRKNYVVLRSDLEAFLRGKRQDWLRSGPAARGTETPDDILKRLDDE